MRSIKRSFLLGTIALAAPALAHHRTPPVPIGSPVAWFLPSDYPKEAKRAGEQGRVVAIVSVDALGNVAGCKVEASSGSAILDATTCELVRARAKFKPGRDEHGRPAASTYLIPTRWVLPDVRTKLEGPWRMVTTLRVNRAGEVVSCKDEKSGPAPATLPTCLLAMQMPANFGIYARGGSDADIVPLVMETSLSFDDSPALPMTFEADGRVTIQLRTIHADVAADGTVSNCQIMAQSGPGVPDPCSSPPGPFLPGVARGITLRHALSRQAAG